MQNAFCVFEKSVGIVVVVVGDSRFRRLWERKILRRRQVKGSKALRDQFASLKAEGSAPERAGGGLRMESEKERKR